MGKPMKRKMCAKCAQKGSEQKNQDTASQANILIPLDIRGRDDWI